MNYSLARYVLRLNSLYRDKVPAFCGVKNKLWFKKESIKLSPVAHACNPSYSGGRNPEVLGQPGQVVCENLS
jgi:hypothetical protein